MIKHVYSFKHEKANYFLKPDINDVDDKAALVSLRRDLVRNNIQYVRNGIQECSFWCLGTFDDETGLFAGSAAMLLSQDEVFKILTSNLGEVQDAR